MTESFSAWMGFIEISLVLSSAYHAEKGSDGLAGWSLCAFVFFMTVHIMFYAGAFK